MEMREHPLAGVKMRRQLLQISSSDLAKRIGVSPSSYFRLERGERRIYLDKAKALAKMLQCTTDDLEHDPSVEEQIEIFRKRKQLENDPDEQWSRDIERGLAEQAKRAQKVGTVVLQNDVNKQPIMTIDDDEPETEEEYAIRMIHGDQ